LTPGEGFAIGWIDDAEFDEYTLQLSPGDRLMLYSDGVPEAMDANLEQLTNERMLQELESSRILSIEEQVTHLRDVVQDWCQPNGPLDDVSILLVDIN
jgi:phosphoserine phosphatase RsbU/P